eukprot:4726855-Prymnesium_polylepis.1
MPWGRDTPWNCHGPPRAAAHDPEGNVVRSVQIHPLISVIAILTKRNQGAPFPRAWIHHPRRGFALATTPCGGSCGT